MWRYIAHYKRLKDELTFCAIYLVNCMIDVPTLSLRSINSVTMPGASNSKSPVQDFRFYG